MKPRYKVLRSILLLTLINGVAIPAVAQAAEEGWRWSVIPYLWASGIEAEIAVDGESVAEVDADFTDIVDELDLGFQIHVEGQRNRWGVFADLTYLALSNDSTRRLVSTDAEIDTGIYELAGVYHLGGTAFDGFDVFAGLRYITVDQDIELRGSGPLGQTREISTDSELSDVMIGARYVAALSDKWVFGIRGDYSTGDSDHTWNALAYAGYRFSIQNTLLFGYRYMEINLEGDDLETEITLSGPITALRFDF